MAKAAKEAEAASAQAAVGVSDRLRSAMRGEVDDSPRRRAEYSSDASLYRIAPQVVVFPLDADDVAAALEVARETSVPITSRGAGTSIAGNAIGPGIVLDFSRHMNAILEINPQARTARVQPGVVMGDLQKAAAAYGLRFGPDPSTWTRATFGGMIGNNACGAHAVAYGRTSDNVIELKVLLADGRRLTAGEGCAEIEGLTELIEGNLAPIRQHLGTFKRQVSGYALEHLLPENGRNLAKFLVGSEGTLAIVTEATLRLVPVPASPALVVLGYEDMAAAADDVLAVMEFEPLAVEGMNDAIVEVVRRRKGRVPRLPEGTGWLFVEVGAREGESSDEVLARAAQLTEAAHTDSFRICEAGPDATELWQIRTDGAGLGGRTAADVQAWPGWEDSAVPPERLGAYVRDLQALLDSHGLSGLMYGHFGDGCVHIRIDFPLDSESGVPAYRTFMEEAARLVASYGGSLSGEHGDGRCRSELLPYMYPPEVIDAFAAVKALFDPEGLLNPGVLVAPDAIDAHLRRPHARQLAYAGGFHFREDAGDLTAAIHRCTGVGNCRADRFASGFWMCPSYDATRDEKDVTRGRVRVLEEMARGELFATWDSPEVLESLDLCLACKACSADCPTGIDVARYRSEAFYRAYKGKLRPRSHYSLGNLPRLARLVHAIPGLARLANSALGLGGVRRFAFRVAGLSPERAFPGFAGTPLAREEAFRRCGGLEVLKDSGDNPDSAIVGVTAHQIGVDNGPRYVALWADSFSHTLDSRGALAAIRLLENCGYTVLVPPADACCGLTWITTGQLNVAKAKLSHLLDRLAPLAAHGIPIVGIEPSCTAVLRSDLPDLLPDDVRASLISTTTFTLAELLTAPEPLGPGDALKLPDLRGVQVVAQPHCHHYSVMGWQADEALLSRTGAEITKISGCCGMAGNFGMEEGHVKLSQAIARRRLLPALAKAPDDAVYLADGFSCRTQAAELAGTRGVHLAELLSASRSG